MIRSVYAALQEAGDRVQAEIRAAGLEMPPPSHDYLAATLHQRLFCTLCKANPEDFSGGRADIAIAIIRNSQRIAKHHWGAEIDIDAGPERLPKRSRA